MNHPVIILDVDHKKEVSASLFLFRTLMRENTILHLDFHGKFSLSSIWQPFRINNKPLQQRPRAYVKVSRAYVSLLFTLSKYFLTGCTAISHNRFELLSVVSKYHEAIKIASCNYRLKYRRFIWNF